MNRIFILVFFLITISFGYAQDEYIQGIPKLAYWQLGKKAETIIVLHGGPGVQHDYLRPEFDHLQDVGKVIYYDQRGCGKSEQADSYTWKEHVKDLKRIINTFSKGEKVILAGSSWGSILAILFAYFHPEDVKGLILSGSVKWGGEGILEKDFPSRSYKHLQISSDKKMLVEHKVIPPLLGDGTPKVIIIKKKYEIFWGAPNLQPKESIFTAPSLSGLKNIQVPALIFNGDREPCTTEVDWGMHYAEILPQAELYTIKGACHDPWFANPTEFFEKSKQFVLRLSTP